jgi:hypothetical protein
MAVGWSGHFWLCGANSPRSGERGSNLWPLLSFKSQRIEKKARVFEPLGSPSIELVFLAVKV